MTRKPVDITNDSGIQRKKWSSGVVRVAEGSLRLIEAGAPYGELDAATIQRDIERAFHQFIGPIAATQPNDPEPILKMAPTQTSVTAQTQGAPQITLTIRADTYRFTPQRDITAFEATRIMALLIPALVTTISAQDLASWWDEAGPDIWRHFSAT